MRKFLLTPLTAILVALAIPVQAATPSEFYVNLLRRGIADVESGEYARATDPLRLAAFGLVDSIEHYETAQIGLTIAWQKLGRAEAARDAARRVIAAQRVERRYAGLTISPSLRTEFEKAAAGYLTAVELAELKPRLAAQQQSAPASAAQRPAMPDRVAQQNAPESAPQQSASTPAAGNPQQTAQQQPKSQPAETQTRPTEKPSTQPPATTSAPAPEQAKATADESARPRPATTDAVTPRQQKPAESPAPAPVRSRAAENNTATSQPPSQKPVLSADAIASRMVAADIALQNSQLETARKLYREVLDSSGLERRTLLRLAEGLYRSRDFANALLAFEQLGPLTRGEEPLHYYAAVALYETGRYAEAKSELAAALPHIEISNDVSRYREKIEAGAPTRP